MRRFVVVFFLLLLCLPFTTAQQTPKADLFAGYSYLRADFTGIDHFNLNGWNASAAGNLNRWFGVVADFSGHYGNQAVISTTADAPLPVTVNAATHAHTFVFGPRLTYRASRATPFVHFLFGGTKVSLDASGSVAGVPFVPVQANDTAFAMALGGGTDFTVSHSLAWRFQADYLHSRAFNDSQHNFRFSTGIVFHLGK